MRPAQRQNRPNANGHSHPALQGQASQKKSGAQTAQQLRRKKQRRARKRFKAIVGLLGILLFFILAVVILANIFSKNRRQNFAEIVPKSSVAANVAAQSQGQMALSMPAISFPSFEAKGPYDEAEMPPLFNFENEIPKEYTQALLDGELVDIGGGQKMKSNAASAFLAMSKAANQEGIVFAPLSAYRSNQRQKDNYNASIERYLAQGFSHAEAVRRTEGYYAIPGTSEHEAGLAIDLGDMGAPGANINDGFENTEAFKWLSEHATEYGFILRYRAEDFAITHIHYEPWHYRYVGANHAAIMAQSGQTLEEYLK